MKDVRFTITVDGKDYPCRQTMGAALDFLRHTGHDIGEDDGSGAIYMIYFCARSVAVAEGRTLPWTPDMFPHMLGIEEAAAIIDIYATALREASDDDDAQKKMMESTSPA